MAGEKTLAFVTNAKARGMKDHEIWNELRKDQSFSQGIKLSKQNGITQDQIAKDLGLRVKFVDSKSKSNYQPFDNTKEARQKREQEALKKQGPTQLWESALLGAADVGVPVVQAAENAADSIRGGINKVFGTNLETDRAEKLTKTYKNTNDNHNTVRKANNQGMDVGRIGANMAMTAPLAAAGGTLKAGVPLASKAGAEFLARNAAVGGLIGATGVHENNTQRLKSMGAGAVGGAIGAAAGQKVGEGVTKVAQKARNKAADALSKVSTVETNRILQSIDDKLGTTQINIDLEINNALQTKGLKLSDLSDDVAKGLRAEAQKALSSGKQLNKEAVVRKAVLDRLGIRGTRAQVTGDPKLWQQEAELAKVPAGDVLRDKFVADNKKIAELLDDAIDATGGRAINDRVTAKTAMDTLLGVNENNKQFVRNAYEIAQSADGAEAVLDGAAFAKEANDLLEAKAAKLSLPSNIKKMLKDVAKDPEKLTLNKADEYIKILNSDAKGALNIKGEDTSTSRAIKIVKKALEDRQAQALDGFLGNDSAVAYKFAKQAHGARKQLEDQMPLLGDAIKGVQPDKLFDKYIAGGSVAELDKTIEVLSLNNPQAVRDIKQQVLKNIAEDVIGQNGQPSPAKMKRLLDNIGDEKLNILFTPDEVRRIKDIGMAMEYLVLQPAHSYVNNANSASALLNGVGKWIKSIGNYSVAVPFIGPNITQPLQIGATKLSTSRAINGAAPLASEARLPITKTSQSLIDQLRKAGLISGANAAKD